MKDAEFIYQAFKRIPNVEATHTHTDLGEGWTLTIENSETALFRLVYTPVTKGTRRYKSIGLCGHKKLNSTDWTIERPYRFWK